MTEREKLTALEELRDNLHALVESQASLIEQVDQFGSALSKKLDNAVAAVLAAARVSDHKEMTP